MNTLKRINLWPTVLIINFTGHQEGLNDHKSIMHARIRPNLNPDRTPILKLIWGNFFLITFVCKLWIAGEVAIIAGDAVTPYKYYLWIYRCAQAIVTSNGDLNMIKQDMIVLPWVWPLIKI